MEMYVNDSYYPDISECVNNYMIGCIKIKL